MHIWLAMCMNYQVHLIYMLMSTFLFVAHQKLDHVNYILLCVV